MKIVFGAKHKLGFITGALTKPAIDHPDHEYWVRADCMVTAWILNSISKGLVDAFLYANSAYNLWNQLESHYDLNNGPVLYQLQRVVASISQGAFSVS